MQGSLSNIKKNEEQGQWVTEHAKSRKQTLRHNTREQQSREHLRVSLILILGGQPKHEAVPCPSPPDICSLEDRIHKALVFCQVVIHAAGHQHPSPPIYSDELVHLLNNKHVMQQGADEGV